MPLRRSFLLLPAMLLLARCGSSLPPPAVLTLRITGTPGQNPDAAGIPAPVAIRIYQLRSTGTFEHSGWAPLTEREQATLGTEDAGSQDVVVAPGQTLTTIVHLVRGVRAIGVVVLYRDINHAQWRAIAAVPRSGRVTLALTVGKLAVSLHEVLG